MSLILCIETGTDVCSVALARGGRLVSLREEAGRDHARKVALFADELFREAGISPRGLDAVAVGRGPGSYTGLRIGTSFAKGLCYALDVPLLAVDHDASTMSSDLVKAVNASSYFRLRDVTESYEQAVDAMEFGDADLIVEIPSGFEENYIRDGSADLLVSINTVNTTKGVLGRAYIQMLTTEFSAGEPSPAQAAPALVPRLEMFVKNMYNPLLDYKHTMVPGLMVVVVMLLCGFMPAVNIVQEKELGTIEQINVTPVSKLSFILAKLIPFWIIGIFALVVSMLLAWLIYGLWPVGSLWNILLFTGLFILTMTGMGLIISNSSSTMQQATFVMLFFVMIFVMMCGLLTPVGSMPDWAQAIAAVNPTKYMVDAMRGIYLKGSDLSDLWREATALAAMALILNVWAILSYRKNS